MTPLVYPNLTREDIQFLVGETGCGAKGADVPDWIFLPACEEHDMLYWVGGTKADRLAADRLFLKVALELSRKQTSWWKRRWYSAMAYIYYVGIRIGSGKFFYYGDKRGREELDLALESWRKDQA